MLAFSQTSNVYIGGYVKTKETKKTIIGAEVFIGGVGMRTNEQGYYKLIIGDSLLRRKIIVLKEARVLLITPLNKKEENKIQ